MLRHFAASGASARLRQPWGLQNQPGVCRACPPGSRGHLQFPELGSFICNAEINMLPVCELEVEINDCTGSACHRAGS